MKDRRIILFSLLILVFGYIVLSQTVLKKDEVKPPVSNWTQLVERIEQKKIDKIELDVVSLQAKVEEKDKKIEPYFIGVPGQAANEVLVNLSKPPKSLFKYDSAPPAETPWWRQMLLNMLPTILLLGLLLFLLRSALPIGKSKTFTAQKAPDTTFKDVAGVGEAIEELEDVKLYLDKPERFKALGAKVPKGILLYGPPGGGKTLLARATAGEAGVSFYSVSGSDFVEMFAGMGASRIRALFKEAKENAPAIIFIDELDAIGKTRTGGGDGATREADQTLNQLLVEMDGFSSHEKPIVIMGASNLINTLDPALLRPGRFDRHINVSAPDKAGRLEILHIHAKDKPFDKDISLEQIAANTAGMTGADLANLLNEAALQASRDEKNKVISKKHVDEALYRIAAGPARHNRLLGNKEKKMTAYHEMGHALLGEILEGTEKVQRISIVPRGESLGQTFYVSEEDIYSRTSLQLKNRICGMLGGRAAEELILGEYGTGAANDLQQANDLAYRMGTIFGFDSKVGMRVVSDHAPVSEKYRTEIDNYITELLDQQYERAKSLLEEHRHLLDEGANRLLQQETIEREDFLEIIKKIDPKLQEKET